MALFAETIVAAFILTIFFSLHIPSIVFPIISFVGAGVLIWLALQVWKIKKINDKGKIFTFKRIFLLTIFNAPFWIFWITICVPQAFLLKQKIAGGEILFLVLFELGWLVATMILTFMFSRFRGLLIKSNLISVVFKVFALILFFFAVKLVINSLALL